MESNMAARGRSKAKSLDRSNYESAQRRDRRSGTSSRAQSDSRATQKNRKNASLPPIESVPDSEESIGRNIQRNGPCGPGQDIYAKFLGPTADETILYGLQLIQRMGSSIPGDERSTLPVDYYVRPTIEDSASRKTIPSNLTSTVHVSSQPFSIGKISKEPTNGDQTSSSEPSSSDPHSRQHSSKSDIIDESSQTEYSTAKMEADETRDSVSTTGSQTVSEPSTLSHAHSQTETELKNVMVTADSDGDAQEAKRSSEDSRRSKGTVSGTSEASGESQEGSVESEPKRIDEEGSEEISDKKQSDHENGEGSDEFSEEHDDSETKTLETDCKSSKSGSCRDSKGDSSSLSRGKSIRSVKSVKDVEGKSSERSVKSAKDVEGKSSERSVKSAKDAEGKSSEETFESVKSIIRSIESASVKKSIDSASTKKSIDSASTKKSIDSASTKKSIDSASTKKSVESSASGSGDRKKTSIRESKTPSSVRKISEISEGESLPPERSKLQLKKSQKSILKESSSSSKSEKDSSSSKSEKDSSSSKSEKDSSGSVSCTCTCSVRTGTEQEILEPNRKTVCLCCTCSGNKKSKCSDKMKNCSKCCRSDTKCISITQTDPGKKIKLCCDCYTSTSSTISDVGEVAVRKELEKGDGNQPVGKIKYAITKITDFGKFTIYEVMKSTRKKPKTMPVGLEGVFVLRRCQA